MNATFCRLWSTEIVCISIIPQPCALRCVANNFIYYARRVICGFYEPYQFITPQFAFGALNFQSKRARSLVFIPAHFMKHEYVISAHTFYMLRLGADANGPHYRSMKWRPIYGRALCGARNKCAALNYTAAVVWRFGAVTDIASALAHKYALDTIVRSQSILNWRLVRLHIWLWNEFALELLLSPVGFGPHFIMHRPRELTFRRIIEPADVYYFVFSIRPQTRLPFA